MIQLDGNTQCIKAIWHTPNELAVSLSRGLFDLLSCCIRVAESNVFSYRSTKENWVLRDNTYDSPPRGCCKITNVYVDIVNKGSENCVKFAHPGHRRQLSRGWDRNIGATENEPMTFHHHSPRWTNN